MYRDNEYKNYTRQLTWLWLYKTFGVLVGGCLAGAAIIAIALLFKRVTRPNGDPAEVARNYVRAVYNENTTRIVCRRVTVNPPGIFSKVREVNQCTVFLQTRKLTLECDYPTDEQPGCTEQ